MCHWLESESKQTSLNQEKEDNGDKQNKSPSINPTTQFDHKISKIKHHVPLTYCQQST